MDWRGAGRGGTGDDERVGVSVDLIWSTFMSDGAYELGLDEFAGFPLFFLLGRASDVCLLSVVNCLEISPKGADCLARTRISILPP